MNCKICQSIAGEKRISPGPPIFEGRYWVIEHAYPSQLQGWLVLVLKRHIEALHHLTQEEFQEMCVLQQLAIKLLHREFHCFKEYIISLGEAGGFQHLHLHIIPRTSGLLDEFKGANIFKLLKGNPLPEADIIAVCERAQQWFAKELLID